MAEIPAEARHLFEGKNFAHVATINPDGSPQVSPVWVGIEGDTVTFNTAAGRVKPRNLERDERVAVSIINQENPYENILVQGRVSEITEDGADEEINALAKRYMDADEYPYRQPGEVRLIVRIAPERVTHQQ
jgi:PPOX class probable F420-dependent enzyme